MTEFTTTSDSTIAALNRSGTRNSRSLVKKRSVELVRQLSSDLSRVREEDPRTPSAGQYGYGLVRMVCDRVYREVDSEGRLHVIDLVSFDEIDGFFAVEVEAVSRTVIFPGNFPGQIATPPDNQVYNGITLEDGTVFSGRLSGTGFDGSLDPIGTQIRFYDGTQTTADPDLIAQTSLDENFIGKGLAYVWSRFVPKEGEFNGDPVVNVIVRARKCVDPRTASTAATFAQQTKVFAFNPYIIIFDHLIRPEILGGQGRDIDELDLDSFADSADWSDMVVDTQGYSRIAVLTERTNQQRGTPPIQTNHILEFDEAVTPFQYGDVVQINAAGTQVLPDNLQSGVNYHVVPIRDRINEFQLPGIALAASCADAVRGITIPQGNRQSDITVTKVGEVRYQSGIVFRSGERILDLLLRSCGASLYLKNGKLAITSQRFPTTIEAVDLGEKIGSISLSTSIDANDQATALTGSFTSLLRLLEPQNYPAVDGDGLFEEEDGEQVVRTYDLPLVAKSSIAQRLALIELRRRRLQKSIAFSGDLRLLRLRPDTVFSTTFAPYGLDANTTFQVRDQTIFLQVNNDAPSVKVDIRGQQLEEAAFNLDLTNEELVDNAKVPGLASPFDVSPPGNLTIVEEPFITRQGAGVRSKAVLSWVASPSLFVERYEVAFKLSAQTIFTFFTSQPELSVDINDIPPGTYDFRVIAINSAGQRSIPATRTGVIIRGLQSAPAAPTNFIGAVVGTAGVQLSWDLSTDLDVTQGGSVEIRHNPQISGGDAKDSTFLRSGTGGQQSIDAPFKQGTYYLFFIDSSGQRSPAAEWSTQTRRPVAVASLVPSTFGDPLDDSNTDPDAFTLQEDNTFPGTQDATTPLLFDTDHLELPLTQTLDDEADFDAITNLDEVGGGDVAPLGIYVFSTAIQITESTPIAIEAILETEIFDLSNSIDDVDDFDAIASIDGVAGAALEAGLATAEIQVRFSTGTIASDTFGPWEKVDTQIIDARSFQFRIVAKSTRNTVNIRINQARIRMIAVPLK